MDQFSIEDLKVISYLLDMAARIFNNHGSNDLNDSLIQSVPRAYWKKMNERLMQWDIEIGDEPNDSEYAYDSDCGLMWFFSHEIDKLIEQKKQRRR